MPVQVWFVNDEVSVEPGSTVKMSVAVENAGDTTETYSVVPAGLNAAWLQVGRSTITVFGGSRDLVEVTVRPPALPTTAAGPTSVAVQVISHTDNEVTGAAETAVTIEPFDDRRVSALQSIKQARRRTTFDVMVENHGNGLANCRLHLVDATGRIDGTFDPPAVGIAPGGSELVKLKARVRGGFLRRARRQLDFEIEANESGHAPAIERAVIIQPPTVSGRAVGRLLVAGLTIGALVAAWFGVVRPEIDDAADRAIDEQLDERLGSVDPDAADGADAAEDATVDPSTTVAVDAADDAVAVAPPPNPDLDATGEPAAYRLVVDVSVDGTRSEALDLPPDRRFELTDLVLQNPNGDRGRAELRRGEDVLYVWDLGAMSSPNEFQPRITPLPFAPGDTIVLSATCDVVGSPTSTGCEISVLMGGVLYPRDR